MGAQDLSASRRQSARMLLDGVRVLDLSRVLAGPYCAMTLGDLGADVIKVERPGQGDDLRQWGPPFMANGVSTYFVAVNRNKRSITVDLRTELGRQLIIDLVGASDVVIENFRQGAMEGYGLGYDRLATVNPRLVYCAISGFGRAGPMRQRPGYDVLMQAFGGLMSVTGEPDGEPQRVGVAIVDIVTGIHAALGVVAALHARQSTGRGRRIDVSLLDSVLTCLPNLTSGFLNAGAIPERHGNSHPNVAPYGVFPTKDGRVVLAVGNDEQWRRLCEAMGEPMYAHDGRFAANAERVARREGGLNQLVTSWFEARTSVELARALTDAGVPNSPIHSIDEILTHPQVEAMEAVVSFDSPTYGSTRLVGAPILDDGARPAVRRPPPLLGEHNEAVLAEVLGIDEAGLARLRTAGAFG